MKATQRLTPGHERQARGTCIECRQLVPIHRDGEAMRHRAPRHGRGRWGGVCVGSGLVTAPDAREEGVR